MKVSVIIPAYNSEKWIKRCLDSILTQSYSNLEIVLVNDGSTDNTLKIVEDIAQDEQRLRIINKQNSGAYFTRSRGIYESTGEAIIHVDSDDYMEPNSIERLMQKMNESGADIVIGNLYKVIGKTKHLIKNNLDVKKGRKELMKALLDNKIKGYLVAKIYKRELMTNLNVLENIILFEDLFINLQVFANHDLNVEYIDCPVYNYFIHQDSVSSTKKPELIESIIETNDLTEALLKRSGLLPALKNEFSAFKCRNWVVYSRLGGKLTKDKSFIKDFYKENYSSYSKRNLAIYQNLEMLAYRHNYTAGKLLTHSFRKIQEIIN